MSVVIQTSNFVASVRTKLKVEASTNNFSFDIKTEIGKALSDDAL